MANKLNFNFGNETASNGRNQIRFTAQLNTVADQRALEALRAASQDTELFELANTVLDGGDATQLFDFLDRTVGNNLQVDSQFLGDATEKELDSMLESRRSDRSKTKKKGLKSSAAIAQKYLACGYAELMVRTAWNKPYEATTTVSDLDTADLDAVNRKIKSLQSKKSRTGKLIEAGAVQLQAEYDEVVAEIDRLSQFRPETRTVSKTVIKDDIDADIIREALKKVDINSLELDDEQAARLADLMSKLG